MKDTVAHAIAEIEKSGVGAGVRVEEDADGGAYVIVEGVKIGAAFNPSTTWIGFHITWAYPDADVYPHFLGNELRYVGASASPNQYPDGNLPTSLTRGAQMPGFEIAAIQVSRRSNNRDADTDSALQKLLRVIEFLRTR